MMDIIGIDIGGVIIKPAETEGDTSFFTSDYLETPIIEGAADVIRRLKEERFGQHMYLVSKCGPRTQEKSREWLTYHNFFERSGMDPMNVHFCRQRSDKARICRRFGINVFIDDRLDVLSHLKTVPTKIHFRNSSKSKKMTPDGSFEFLSCNTWEDVGERLLSK